jgi:hypothetical protein
LVFKIKERQKTKCGEKREMKRKARTIETEIHTANRSQFG